MAFISDPEAAFAAVADSVGPSTVRIGGGWRGGSGVVVEPGYVLTNAHNVRSQRVPVIFADGRRAEGRLAGIDVDGDLAVIEVEGAAAALEWATDATARLGMTVFGVALNGSGPRVTMGYVSGAAAAFRGPRGRRISGSIEHTAPLAPGSSGGPLVDATGRLVGINTNRLGRGFYLALPADEALRERVASLRRGESVERPRLGVGVAPSAIARRLRRQVGLPERDGLLVRAVEEGSPAEGAGIVEGDLIVAAGGRELRDADDLHDALAAVAPGGSLELRIVRGTDERSVTVAFGGADGNGGSDAGPVH